jgi:hypothetical protein
LTTAQACVLLGAFSITRGEAHAESVYYCVACRIANLLNLANKSTSDPIEREVNIRGGCKLVPHMTPLADRQSLVVTVHD